MSASFELRTTAPEDLGALRRIRAEPEVVRWWGRPHDDFPHADADDDVTRLTVVVDGEVGGMVQYWEDPDPESRHADVDIFLATRLHGRGIGTAVMRAVAAELARRGHHRLTLSTDPANARAIRAYENAGFRPVGITRQSARHDDGTWRDELLMDRVEGAGAGRED